MFKKSGYSFRTTVSGQKSQLIFASKEPKT